MIYLFVIKYRLRVGLGPKWEDKTEEVALDDLEEGTSIKDAEQMAISEFSERRRKAGTHPNAFYIKEIVSA